MKYLLILLVAGLTVGPTLAQQVAETADLPSPPVPFDQPVSLDNLTLEDGLAQGSLYEIHQDRKGFMWFGRRFVPPGGKPGIRKWSASRRIREIRTFSDLCSHRCKRS